MHPPDHDRLVARMARFCAALYRTVPLEGQGLLGQAAELAHAAELDAEADLREAGGAAAATALTGRDIRIACQLLIDVRRAPNALGQEEVALARRHFPEVEERSLDALERLIGFYTGLLRERGRPGERTED